MLSRMRAQITPTSLRGCQILVIEDEYFLADDICAALKDLGADIVGPVGQVGDATEIVNSGQSIDGAVLDINLWQESIYPVADILRARKVPFIFTSGYEKSAIDTRFKDIQLFEKPFDTAAIANSLGLLIGETGRDPYR